MTDAPDARSTLVRAVSALAALVAYGLAVPVMVGTGPILADSGATAAATVLLVLSTYTGCRIAYELGTGASRWFVLIFHAFAFVFLGVAPLAQIGARALFWAADPVPSVLLEASVVCLIGVVLFDAGLWFGGLRGLPVEHPLRRALGKSERRPNHARERPAEASRPSEYSADRALVLLILLTVVSLVLFWVRGGLELVFASRAEMEAALCSVGPSGELAECGVVTALIHVPPVILAVVAVGLRDRGHRPIVWLAIIIGIVGLILTANPASTGRFWVGAAAIGLLGVTVGQSLRARLLIWLAIPTLLIFVYPTLDFGRQQDWSLDFSIRPETLTQKQDFDAFQQIANGITFVDTFGTRDGAQSASALLFFIPRSIWPDKAPATGPMVAADLGVTYNLNVSAPLWEEAYVDFGLGGVAVVFGVLGYVIARLEAAVQALAARGSRLTQAVAPFFAGYGVFVLRGPLLPAIGPFVVAILLVWVVRRSGAGHVTSHRTQEIPGGRVRPAVSRALETGGHRVSNGGSEKA